MIFECKKMHRYDRLISYLACLFFLLLAIFIFFILHPINAPTILKFFTIVTFLIIAIILPIEIHRNSKFNIYKIEISPNTLIIYVNNTIGQAGTERIQLNIDKCQIQEIYQHRVGMVININDGHTTYKLNKSIFEDKDYQLIKNALIEDYPEIASAPEYKWVTTLCSLGVFFQFAMIYWPKPFKILYMILIFFPILSFIPLKVIMNNLKVYVDNRRTPNSVLISVLLAPCICLSMRILHDWNILKITWSDFWIPFYIFSAVYLASLIFFVNGFKINDIFTTFALIICFIYGFQATIALNCLVDSSAPALYRTSVINKRIHTYKGGKTYYIRVSPCGPIEHETDVKVEKVIYQKFNPGDEVNLFIHKGLFKMPWYYIDLKEPDLIRTAEAIPTNL